MVRKKKRGRPPKFVRDPNGREIHGLSHDKTCGYYATFTKPRVYFSRDFSKALFEFNKWSNAQQAHKPVVELNIPYSSNTFLQPSGQIDWEDISNDPPVIVEAYQGDTACIPEPLFIEKAREIILTDPITAAKKLAIPELARLDSLPRLEKPLPLKRVLVFYLTDRCPSSDEARKMKTVWKEFCDIVGVPSVREITCDMIHNFKDWAKRKQRKKGYKNSWVKMRFTKIKTLIKYSYEQGRSNKPELRRVLEWCKCLKVSSAPTHSCNPITKENLHKLLNVANTRMRAMILLGINCGYYGKDLHDLKKSMIKQKNGLDYIVFPREKNKHMRVNVLWEITKDSLDRYMAKHPNNGDYVFSSQYGTPLDAHDVQRCFDRLRKKTGVPDEVKFNNLRDGAASSLFGKVNSDLIRVTIGHRIRGEKSKYIQVKPEQVAICAKHIWNEYYG